jgi:superfamily II DNA or RNA helicase
MEQLIHRVWENPKFHDQLAIVSTAWLQRELDVSQTASLTDAELVQCVQAAAILSGSTKPAHRRAAFSVAACAADLGREHLPGLDGALRIVLSRMGNFPAIQTAATVDQFSRLPMPVALSEELRRERNRVVIGDTEFELTDFQRRLWKVLSRGDNVAVSAPTSAGKSFVLQAYLRARARAQSITSACYIVPSRALIAQVGDAIAGWRRDEGLNELALVTIPLGVDTKLRTPAIYVLTQERLQATLTAHPEFVADLIICDEAQNVEEGARGVLLQNVVDQLLARNSQSQTVFAGPNIKNLSAFGSIFDVKLLQEVESRSPSVVQNLILVNTRSLIKGQLALQRFSRDGGNPIGETNIERQLPSIKERLVRVAERFGQQKPSIIYANGPADAEGVAKGLADVVDAAAPSERVRDLIVLAKTAVHCKYDLAACLNRSVAFHYGRIPALVRRGIEAAFADGEIKFLVTTSTLIQGVNFPAANLFVCKPRKGSNQQLDSAEFWNLAGRAGRLGKEFQGKIFLIDYDEWPIKHADQSDEIHIQSSIQRTLTNSLEEVVECAREVDPPLETEQRVSVEATFARLLADRISGRLEQTLDRCEVPVSQRASIVAALDFARSKVTLPEDVIAVSPTVSALRQQRLADYLTSELKGGGVKRLEELIPRHPRDDEAYVRLSEIFKICHRSLLSLEVPRLHLRMAAIALKWMRGDPVPEIVDENHRRSNGTDIAKSIRETLKDIEQEIRFKYLRLTSCYNAVLGHSLITSGRPEYVSSIPNLPNFLEVGAADQTMVSFIGLGISRVTARELTDAAMNKDMDQTQALEWLRGQNLETLIASRLMRLDAERALATYPI